MPGKAESTIYSITSHAGVSIRAVSRFLNVPDKVYAETAQRRSTIDLLGYSPHGHAVMRVQRSMRWIRGPDSFHSLALIRAAAQGHDQSPAAITRRDGLSEMTFLAPSVRGTVTIAISERRLL
jgi:hypothetical protein